MTETESLGIKCRCLRPLYRIINSRAGLWWCTGCAARPQLCHCRRLLLDEPPNKVCRTCEQRKPLSAFERRTGTIDGYRIDCRACRPVDLEGGVLL